jgi:hypothetical protein
MKSIYLFTTTTAFFLLVLLGLILKQMPGALMLTVLTPN